MMDLNFGQSQVLKQEQILSPQMLQSLNILQMPLLDLQTSIQEELNNNPALEYKDPEEISLNSSLEKSYDDRLDDADSSYYEDTSFNSGFNSNYDDEASDRNQMMIENSTPKGEELSKYLLKQLGESSSDPIIDEISRMLISNLDSNGFLILDNKVLFEGKNFKEDDINKALNLVQSFDPPGICVKDFKESLVLQAKLSGMADSDLEIFSEIVYNYLEKLNAKKINDVSRALKIPEEDVQSFLDILKSFTPYPGSSFSYDNSSVIIPDFSIHQKDGNLTLDINRSMIPELSISSSFSDLAKDLNDQKALSYIKENINKAENLITQVELRFKTLAKAALAIMEMQSEFFFKGPRYLKAMTLKDIAQKIDFHESTISRLANEKYVETDWGIFQLTKLFSQGVSTTNSDTENISKMAVQKMIKEIISENNNNLSDQKISDILKEKYNIQCARRTVNKYRKELNIDSSYNR